MERGVVSEEDADLVSSVADDLTGLSHSAPQHLTREQRDIVLTWHAYGMVSCGGLHCYYEGDFSPREVPGAFTRLGLPKAARAFRESLRAFPRSLDLGDDAARLQFLKDHHERLNQRWKPLEHVIFDVEDALMRAVASRIRAKPGEYSNQHPLIRIERLYYQIHSRLKKGPVRSLTEPERNLYRTWGFRMATLVDAFGIVTDRIDIPATCAALKAIGAIQTEGFLTKAGKVIARLEAPGRRNKNVAKVYKRLDADLKTVLPELVERLMAYVRVNFP